MGKTRTFQVISNRMQFICPTCRTRKSSMIPRVLRRKNMKCSKCAEVTRCIFERRTKPRELQTGKILMLTGGKELEVFLHDISIDGIGVDLPVKALRSGKLTTGREVRFKCSWNPRLINGNFVINNVKDQRVGVEKVGR